MQEYTSENIDWTRVEFEDNQECLELIEKVKLYVAYMWILCSVFSSTSFGVTVTITTSPKVSGCIWVIVAKLLKSYACGFLLWNFESVAFFLL